MTTPSGNRPPPSENTLSDDRLSSIRANARTAVAALEAVANAARADYRAGEAVPITTRRDLDQERARLPRMLCALRHLADQVGGIAFSDVLSAANEQYLALNAGPSQPATTSRVVMADGAIGIFERSIAAPRQQASGFWPPDTLSYLHGYASRNGLGFEPAVASLMAQMIADLRHYADHQGINFQQALATGLRAHALRRLRAEGPFQTGQEPGQLQAPSFPLPVGASFQPTATNQGVVVSHADAEWLLIRTAARNQERWQNGLPADRRDADDERVLTEALAAARGQAAGEIFTSLAPQIAARAMQIEDGPAAAAELGREHGRTAAPPYCDLDIDGDATALLHALGETEWMTHANHQYRVSLVTAYAKAYQQAAGNGPAPADSPARIASRDFPRQDSPGAQAVAPSPDRPTRTRGYRPRHGPRPGAR
jgi:hypothetical protein